MEEPESKTNKSSGAEAWEDYRIIFENIRASCLKLHAAKLSILKYQCLGYQQVRKDQLDVHSDLYDIELPSSSMLLFLD